MDFIDIIDFTKKASTLDPAFLIQKLNEIYAAFDKIIDNCTCERIKTIGDSYMAVSGLPEPDPEHAKNILRSCIEMIRFLRLKKRHLH
ncbi:MAG TPA: adenylate/guanylate cyclase domain-containing protein [Bacteroidales bacterium]|nr:adenylate/guanylate cyclase domain-containing protein [Bacteroidales bacterium]